MSKNIILIEDDRDIIDVINYILTDEGYEVISAVDSGPLKNVLLYQPMLILMDDRIVDGFGSDFCRSFKSDPLTSHFPVVLMSANNNLEQMAIKSLADGYLKKPFDINELIDLVKRFE